MRTRFSRAKNNVAARIASEQTTNAVSYAAIETPEKEGRTAARSHTVCAASAQANRSADLLMIAAYTVIDMAT